MRREGEFPFLLRLLRWLLVLLSIPNVSAEVSADEPRLAPFAEPQPRMLAVPLGNEPFDAYEALNGATSSLAQCSRIPGGLWVEVEGKGDCIRYYAEGLADAGNPEVLVYFGGDIILRTSKGVRLTAPSYLEQSPNRVHADMANWSRQSQRPTIFLARPGTFGSSGDHNMRRYRREIALVDGALEQIKQRHRVGSFILTGQSGGGHMVASLLNRRRDISAAVISSGLVSVKRVMAYWDKRRSLPGWLLYDAKSFYDPVDDVDRIGTSPRPDIYVLSDPEDRVVPFLSQLHYVRRLRAAGFRPQHIYAYAPDKRRHVLSENARLAAAMIARGRDSTQVRRALDELDLKRLVASPP